jgi:hypothetical protein
VLITALFYTKKIRRGKHVYQKKERSENQGKHTRFFDRENDD